MYKREYYLSWLRKWQGPGIIKVITGIRRSGKSSLLELFRQELLEKGISEKSVCYINFEKRQFNSLKNKEDVWSFLDENLTSDGPRYVFLDEVQRLPDFTLLIDEIFAEGDIDLYVTGSNAYLLSSDLSTYLSGRYVEIHLQPFSFKEYVEARGVQGDYQRYYNEYIVKSSFPYALNIINDSSQISDYLEGIYNTVMVKDVLARKKLADVGQVDRISRYLFDNIGNLCSLRTIAAALCNGGYSVQPNTVDSYIDLLCEAYIFYKAPRFNVRGKELLRSGCKYYCSDVGLRYHLLGNRPGDEGHIMENIVYLELLRRSRNVFVGQYNDNEIDFVTRDGDDVHYYQVALTLRDEAVRKREYAPLLRLRDHYPKTVITMDYDIPADLNGIRQVNLWDFLLG